MWPKANSNAHGQEQRKSPGTHSQSDTLHRRTTADTHAGCSLGLAGTGGFWYEKGIPPGSEGGLIVQVTQAARGRSVHSTQSTRAYRGEQTPEKNGRKVSQVNGLVKPAKSAPAWRRVRTPETEETPKDPHSGGGGQQNWGPCRAGGHHGLAPSPSQARVWGSSAL